MGLPATPPRLPDWQTRLIGYLNAAARCPFKVGTHDCCLFAAGAVRAMTGSDPAAGYRERYTTLKGGLRVLRKAGFKDHVDMAQTLFSEVHASRAAPGDLAVVDTPEGAALGVVQGESVYVLGPDRIGLLPIAAARLFLRVG